MALEMEGKQGKALRLETAGTPGKGSCGTPCSRTISVQMQARGSGTPRALLPIVDYLQRVAEARAAREEGARCGLVGSEDVPNPLTPGHAELAEEMRP